MYTLYILALFTETTWEQRHSNSNEYIHLCSFPIASAINYHILSGFKQYIYFLIIIKVSNESHKVEKDKGHLFILEALLWRIHFLALTNFPRLPAFLSSWPLLSSVPAITLLWPLLSYSLIFFTSQTPASLFYW